MGNASQINRSRNSVRVERRSDLNESDLGEVYCICSVTSKKTITKPAIVSSYLKCLKTARPITRTSIIIANVNPMKSPTLVVSTTGNVTINHFPTFLLRLEIVCRITSYQIMLHFTRFRSLASRPSLTSKQFWAIYFTMTL